MAEALAPAPEEERRTEGPDRGLFSTPEPAPPPIESVSVPQLERRSSYTSMTRAERDTYDTARGYGSERFLFVPRMGVYSSRKVVETLSKNHVRQDARIVLVDGADVAEIPYEDFQNVDVRLFVEILRYAHGRHLQDRPGNLIGLTESLMEKTRLP